MPARPGAARTSPVFIFYSNRIGCLGSLALSVVLTIVLLLAIRGCSS